MYKKIIVYSILIIWMIVIFMFSSQQKTESHGLSDKIIDTTIKIYEKITDKKLTVEKRRKAHNKLAYPVRKMAHVTEYLILGILIYIVLAVNNVEFKKSLIISILFCFGYAASDEIHQLFVSGRTSNIFDVLIDTCGGILGILLCYSLSRKEYKPIDTEKSIKKI